MNPMAVSRHTADGATSPSITRLYGFIATATTEGTVEFKNGDASGAVLADVLVPLNESVAVTGLNISFPNGVYVDITTFAGRVYVFGG